MDKQDAINIDPGLLDTHRPIIEKSDWIEANLRLMAELGERQWLARLLAVLEGGQELVEKQ